MYADGLRIMRILVSVDQSVLCSLGAALAGSSMLRSARPRLAAARRALVVGGGPVGAASAVGPAPVFAKFLRLCQISDFIQFQQMYVNISDK